MNGIDNMRASVSKILAAAGQAEPAATQAAFSEEDSSKDAFFARIAELAQAMIAAHGNDFAIGTLVLAAKFIAEGKPLITQGDRQGNAKGESAGTVKPA